jgi:hypothetical protein
MPLTLFIRPDGDAVAIYDETLDLRPLGQLSIQRASRVEPEPDGNWTADLSPVGGPTMGPFRFRSSAIRAEISWLTGWLTGHQED